jgi:hypothetical protein
MIKAIHEYAEQMKTRETEEYQLAAEEERTPGQYWIEVDPPKVGVKCAFALLSNSLLRLCRISLKPS